jgi:hypothetical protein
MAIGNYLDTVPQYASDGSVDPVPLGGAIQTLTQGGWIENKGSSDLYLVPVGDADAAKDPISRGLYLQTNKREPLFAGMTLASFGLLADGEGGACLVIGM